MKPLTIVLVAAIALVASGPAMGAIVGTGHDFTTSGWSDGELCVPCHAPHNAMNLTGGQFDVGDGAPLWNHELTTATYDTHSGTGVPRDDALDSRSILCMSCHDGTVALDAFGGEAGGTFIGGDELLGTDLSNDHPVGADGVYPLVSWMNAPVDGKVGNLPLNLMDVDGAGSGPAELVVSCTSCHEPHDRYRHEPLLRMDNSGSALCLTCHKK